MNELDEFLSGTISRQIRAEEAIQYINSLKQY